MMKKILFVCSLLVGFVYPLDAQIIIANEIAIQDDDWSAGDGFNQWSFYFGENTGKYVGSPGDASLSTTGIGTDSFALYATGNRWADGFLQLDQPMQVGEKLTFYWAFNWDANGGSKGFDFQHSSTSSAVTFYTIINTNGSTITAGGNNADTGYGTTPMLVTLNRTSSTQYQFTMSSRSGGSDYTSTITESNAIDRVKFFVGGQNDGNTNRNLFFNKFKIQSNSNSVTVSSDKTYDNLEILLNTNLTIEQSGSLNVLGTLTNEGSIAMNSSSNEYSSLIVGSKAGTAGTYTYNRYISDTNTFDIISAPFTGQTFSDLLSNNSGVIYDNSNDPTQYAYGPFDNDSGAYVQYDSDTDGNQTMDAGLGFRTGTDSGATLAFTGTFQTSDVTEPISLGSHATYGRWNLIGNPFPSYLDLYHFFDDNDSNIESGTYNAVYTYDGDDSNGSVWTTYNLSNVTALGQYYIAPGQAFFVAASGSTNVSFDTDMQSVSGGDDFLPGERRPNDDSFAQNNSSSNSKISLALSFDDSKYAATDIYLNTRASSGLDVGYDAGTFANQAGSLGLYSFLADGSHPETKLAIQAVSNNISDLVVIPLGVNAQSGIDYTIKLKERPQQEGVFVYLKDKLDNSMTLLTDQDYSFNTSTDLQGDGRFEIHLSAFALSTFDISKAPYSMIGLRGKVQVTGELSKGDVITILDLRGRTLAKQTVNSPTQSATVQLNGVSKGVYIGKVENNIGQYNTKFILK